jgi:REP element-mobilizing transposase RayT
MATPRRYEEEGAIHHVFGHAIADSLLFVERFDYEEYLRVLERVARKFGWQVMSYCLMSNHVHLLVKTPEPNLGAGMQHLHGRYAREFNARHGKRGARFREGYGSRRVLTDENLFAVLRYIPMNPVNAGMCVSAEEYEWSSHGPLVGGDPPDWMGHAELLWLLGTVERYVRIVSA